MRIQPRIGSTTLMLTIISQSRTKFYIPPLSTVYLRLPLLLFTTVRVSLAFPDGRTLAFPSILHRRNDGRNQCPRIRRGGDESTIVASFFLALLAPDQLRKPVTQRETLSLTQEQTLLKCSSLLKYVYFLFQDAGDNLIVIWPGFIIRNRNIGLISVLV